MTQKKMEWPEIIYSSVVKQGGLCYTYNLSCIKAFHVDVA